ncbi:ABC transporter substrate-binding protein [Actinopolymorpha pittospori]
MPSQLKQAPTLAKQVEAGTLPPVEERVPGRPYVVPHNWLQPGKYGGSLSILVPATNDSVVKQNMYGNSILRFLNDMQDVGPGLAESWETNDDATEWVFHFRKGLRWSDGQPWTTADILYWWEDLVLNDVHPAVVPPDMLSGNTVARMSAPDDHTLTLTFDAPAPITAERLAARVKGGNGDNGPIWISPKHYMQQFHPSYNKKIKPDGNWYDEHDNKLDFATNPDCPTMTGWRLQTLKEGSSSTWVRNPYYWCVDRSGQQLPYIDRLVFTAVQDKEAQKLYFTEGKVDFAVGGTVTAALTLDMVASLKRSSSGLQVWFWDSGSGTGSIFFFNHDYPEVEMRELIRNPTFRQALSHAFNREEARKSIYFNTGETTTGTLSPKGPTFQIDDQGRQLYRQWRDSYIAHDPSKAKAMLDEIGVVDKDGDGYRELPSGGKLVVRIDYPADASTEHVQKNDLLKRDWEAVGIKVQINPLPPATYPDQWGRGELMSQPAWEVGDNAPLIYPGWVIPVEPAHWAPLHGQAFMLRARDPEAMEKEKDVDPWKRQPPWLLPEKGDTIDRLWSLYGQAQVETDEMKRTKLFWDVFKVHIDEGPFLMGCVANYPTVVLGRNDLRNVPRRENLALGGWTNPWHHPTPAVYDPETFFWADPTQHD